MLRLKEFKPLCGKWITSGKENDKNCLLPPETYKKTFTLSALPHSARLNITAMGIYTAYINGKRVGEDFFTPGYTNYKSHIQVQEYDVLGMLKCGENTIEVTVANGWYLGRIGNKHNVYGSKRGLLAELVFDSGAGMVSFNHYAYGTVGDFFYRRILGLEQEEAGYKTFVVKPVLGGGIKWAKGSLQTNFGCIQCEWKDEEEFYLKVNVPKGAKCKVVLPDKTQTYVTGGEYEFTCKNGGYFNE